MEEEILKIEEPSTSNSEDTPSQLITPVQTEKFVTPKIQKITTQGEVFVLWDKPMKLPSNHTDYVE